MAAYFASSARLAADEHHGRIAQGEWLVEAPHQLARALIVGADEHPVGVHEVLDRGALAQELGIGADGEVAVGTDRAQTPLDLAARSDRNCRLRHDHREVVEVRGEIFHRAVDVGEIRVAVAAAHGRADREQHDVGALHRAREVVGEQEALGLHVAGEQIVEARLVDRRVAGLELGQPVRVLVDARHRPAELGEAGGGDEPDVAGTDHADVQGFPPLWRVRRTSAGDM